MWDSFSSAESRVKLYVWGGELVLLAQYLLEDPPLTTHHLAEMK